MKEALHENQRSKQKICCFVMEDILNIIIQKNERYEI
jgi:hypothetical protein